MPDHMDAGPADGGRFRVRKALLTRRRPKSPGRMRIISAWMVVTGVLAICILATGAVLWLLAEADRAKPDNRPALRIDAIKTGLAVAAGTGGAAALLLTARRQWLAERAQAHTEEDATERRITELYSKAVEQLGSERALVRLGALYALERLAQSNPMHRQTVVNVICAYLRMPFKYPPTSADADSDADQRRDDDVEVRLAAQRILTGHLTARSDATAEQLTGRTQGVEELLWLDISLDLSHATLIDIDLRRCHLEHATFTGAAFHGRALFSDGVLGGGAGFNKAVFHGPAFFVATRFQEVALFKRTQFLNHATFSDALFADDAAFGSARFRSGVRFDRTTFERGAGFDRAAFERPPQMVHARARLQTAHGHSWPAGWRLDTATAADGYGTLAREVAG